MEGHTSRNIGTANTDLDGASGGKEGDTKLGRKGRGEGFRKSCEREGQYDEHSLYAILEELR